MKGQKSIFPKVFLVLPVWLLISCSASEINRPTNTHSGEPSNAKFSYLALGDSYTVGESVPNSASFPKQLVAKLNEELEEKTKVQILATTGWRTDNLISAMDAQLLSSEYDIVTLLIGVNNQFQNRSFSQYETEFNTLLNRAISLARGESNRVFVISIPDYAFTPFAANSDREKISAEIDKYNDYAREQATTSGVSFIAITDITRMALDQPELVASDGLHPSEEAYRRFVERILPYVRSRLAQ